ncbi:MAG: glycosyltransferase, partial [Clostridia bacterium]|nr:glycosyltransferase [Clostridia bacterium]
PMVAFTGDNEYSLRKFSFSPIFWLNELILRRSIRKMMPRYRMYYTLSLEQKEEYEKRFGVRTEVIHKCGEVPTEIEKTVNDPIRIVYAGKLYCGRWKTLAAIGKALDTINADGVKMILDIYTRDAVSDKQKKLLDDGKSIFLRGAAKPEDILGIYQKSDIALHVESFDLKHRLATRVSFSTKIIDCLASSCAVMAIAWREHSGLTYLEREDAAICISSVSELAEKLKEIADHPDKMDEYRKKASACMERNHQRTEVQKKLYQSFEDIISNQ